MRGQRFFRKSDNPLISRFSLAAALACLTLLLSACPNPVSTNDPQSAAVLSVVGTVPSNGATGFDPGQTILVSFSKDLDPSCLTDIQSPVVISPSTLKAGSSITLTFSYDSPNKKLSIEPHPYLESNATY
ncbi:MAG TPA: Ig-like domain-containing protein, partial [Spirochaetia bacterium]|nr:Ig-like domain-containing protein [Spirochaetia bacterium]